MKRYLYWWLSFIVGYLFPFTYFFVKLGITKTATSIVMPVVILGIFAILKLCTAIPTWIATWQPSVMKGLIKSIPIFLLFICLVTFGLVFKYMLEHQINDWTPFKVEVSQTIAEELSTDMGDDDEE